MNKQEIYNMVFRHEISADEAFRLLSNMDGDEKNKSYMLTSIQKSLWLSNIMYPDISAYNLPVPIIVNEEVTEDILFKTCTNLVSIHPNLRTIFSHCNETEDGEPFQRVRPDNKFYYEYIDISKENFINQKNIVLNLYKKPFDLAKDYLFRVFNFKMQKDKHLVLLVVHHIVADGPSLSILASNFVELYCSIKSGSSANINKPKATYKEFVDWQNSILESEYGKKAEEFWMEKLNNNFKGIDFPKENIVENEMTFEGKTILKYLEPKILKKLQKTAKDFNISLYVLTLGAFFILLNKYSGQEELQIGSPMYGRPNAKFSDCVGFFSSTTPIFSTVPLEKTFHDYVTELKKEIFDIMNYSSYPFFKVADRLGKSSNSLYTIVFAVQAFLKELGRKELDSFGSKNDYDLELVNSIQQEGVFDIFLEIQEKQDDAFIAIKYKKGVFTYEFIESVLENYTHLLNDICDNPFKMVYQLDCICEKEKNYLLDVVNDTEEKLAQLCVHEIINQHSNLSPTKKAIIFQNQAITYKELNSKSNYIANQLIQKGVQRGDVIGVYMDRSAEVIIAMLAIFKTGAVYLPYDTKLPLDRLKYIMEETNMKLVLTNDNRINAIDNNILKISVEQELKNYESNIINTSFKSNTQLKDIAYIIYTSGSTGKPKGVQVWHSSLTNITQSMIIEPGVVKDDYTIAIASISFDMSLLEILPILCVGGTIEMLTSDIIDDGIKLTKKLREIPLTYFCATPSLYEILFVTDFKSKTMSRAWVAGDVLTKSLAQRMMEHYGVIWNMCGPTEASIITTIQKITDSQKVGIGKPIHNYQIYILDAYKQLVPAGAKGELYIGGAGINEPCYYKREEINNNKFIKNPFGRGKYLHKSGDLVSFMQDGNLNYYCRIDGMVKFRGLRIELEEIDNQLLKLPNVRNVATVIRNDNSNHSEIVSFIIFQNESCTIEGTVLSDNIGKWLPNYMIPSYYVVLKEMPLNINSKINRKYLSTQAINTIIEEYTGYILEDNQEGTNNIEDTISDNTINDNANMEKLQIVEEDIVYKDFSSDELLDFVNRDIKKIVSDIIELSQEEVGDYTPFSNMEFDSLRFVKLAVGIKKEFSIDISPVIFNNIKNVSSLSVYIVTNFPTEITDKYCKIQKQEELSQWTINSEAVTSAISASTCSENDIAIIGISYKLPFGNSENQIMDSLLERRQAYNIGSERAFCKSLRNWKGYFLDNIWEFDNEYFRYSKNDSSYIDPQQRIMLQLTAQLFADAGYEINDVLHKKVGVFIGTTREEYKQFLYNNGFEECDSELLTNAYMSSNISSFFKLEGPSKVLNASLSSSVSLCDAIDSIHQGQCKMAIAGGINILFSDKRFQDLNRTNRMSQDYKKGMLSDDVCGVIPSEGAVVLLLKPLKYALEDNNKIYAVIKDAKSLSDNSSLLVPTTDSLVQLLKQTYTEKPLANIDYIDSLGLGTKFSDENEVLAYTRALDKNVQQTRENKIIIGSSRSQFGDMEGVSVYASIIKILHMMKNNIIPATLSKESSLNKRVASIAVDQFEFTTESKKWNSNNRKSAAITEIGVRGENTHIVLEQFIGDNRLNMKKDIHIDFKINNCLPPDNTVFKTIVDNTPVVLGISNLEDNKDILIQYWKHTKDNTVPTPLGSILGDIYLDNSPKRLTHMLVKLESTGTMLEVIVKGSGKPILMIPGFGLTACQFIPQFLDSQFEKQMIVIHMPGVGLSEPCEDVSFEAIASYYIEVLDVLGIRDKIDLIGTSWGGVLAQFLAIKYEKRCNTIILANTSAELTVNSHVGLKELVYEDFENAGASESRQLFDDSTCISDKMALKYESVLYQGKGKTNGFLDDINIPTLILAGEKDMLLPLELSERMHKDIKSSELYVFSNSGHSSNITAPEEFNKVCKEFLGRYNVEKGNSIGGRI